MQKSNRLYLLFRSKSYTSLYSMCYSLYMTTAYVIFIPYPHLRTKEAFTEASYGLRRPAQQPHHQLLAFTSNNLMRNIKIFLLHFLCIAHNPMHNVQNMYEYIWWVIGLVISKSESSSIPGHGNSVDGFNEFCCGLSPDALSLSLSVSLMLINRRWRLCQLSNDFIGFGGFYMADGTLSHFGRRCLVFVRLTTRAEETPQIVRGS